jgi:riboflavin kinase / FMN adenylyltransferase
MAAAQGVFPNLKPTEARMMFHYWSLDSLYWKNSWLTIGSFDGVHRGHQEIIHQMAVDAHAHGSPAVVISFYPHPAKVLGKRQDFKYLSTPEERNKQLRALGVDLAITHPFNHQVAGLSARAFMHHLQQHLGLLELWVGYDFALGRKREGDIPALKQLGEEFGYRLHVVAAVNSSDQPVSSSQVRAALAQGDVQQAERLLGRPYGLDGMVIPGDGRGHTIGIPTANLEIWNEKAVPKPGVYVCQASFESQTWGAVTNIGFRPTFENQPVLARVETHLLDFRGDLYGKYMQLVFLERLRDEQRFPNIESLVQQIHSDIHQARLRLAIPHP